MNVFLAIINTFRPVQYHTERNIVVVCLGKNKMQVKEIILLLSHCTVAEGLMLSSAYLNKVP